MSQSKQSIICDSLRRQAGLWIIGCLADGECGRLVAVPSNYLQAVLTFVRAETELNACRLKEYSAELMSQAEALLLADELDDGDGLLLAAKLIALHGPAGRTASLISNAGRFAGTVEIDRSANLVRYSSVPVTTAFSWFGIDEPEHH